MTTHPAAPSCDNAQNQDSERPLSQDACPEKRYTLATRSLTNEIRRLRRERKWSLRKLSEVSGISINALWRMEQGGFPMLGKAVQLAAAFQLTIYEVWDIPAPVPRTPSYIALLPDRMKIRALRNARGLRLEDLATATGIPKSTLSEVERGATPSLKNAVRIAVALGVSVHQLWSTPGRKP